MNAVSAPADWQQGDAHWYRIDVTVDEDPAAASSSGTATFKLGGPEPKSRRLLLVALALLGGIVGTATAAFVSSTSNGPSSFTTRAGDVASDDLGTRYHDEQ